MERGSLLVEDGSLRIRTTSETQLLSLGPNSSSLGRKISLQRNSSLCGESPPNSFQFFEVLFLGSVPGSHRKVLASGVDSAVTSLLGQKGRLKECRRSHSCSSSGKEELCGAREGRLSSSRNSTMLLQVGRKDLRLISPESHSVLLHKSLRDISHCSPGASHPTCFSLVCRASLPGSYLSLVFQSTSQAVVQEVIHGLGAAFREMSPARSPGVKKEQEVQSGLGDVARRAKRSLAGGFSGMLGGSRRKGEMVSGESLGEEEAVTLIKVVPLVKVLEPTPGKMDRDEDMAEDWVMVQKEGAVSITGTVCDGAPAAGQPASPRRVRDYRELWRQQGILNRMERENRNLQQGELQLETAAKLSYLPLVAPASLLPSLKDAPSLALAVSRGVKPGRRGELWLLLASNSPAPPPSLAQFPALTTPYRELKAGLAPHQHAILVDLGRTFPEHQYFRGALGPGQLGLFNLLKAYSLLDPEVGYCQGLPFPAGLLLMHLEEDQAFGLLCHLLMNLGLREVFHPDMAGLQLALHQVSGLLSCLQPSLSSHLEKLGADTSLYATPWLVTLFAAHFPLGFVARVLDLVFLQGTTAVIKVVLCLLAEAKEQVLAARSLEQVMAVLRLDLPAMEPVKLENIIQAALILEVSSRLDSYRDEYSALRGNEAQGASPGKHLQLQDQVVSLTARVTSLTKELQERDLAIDLLKEEVLRLNGRSGVGEEGRTQGNVEEGLEQVTSEEGRNN